MVKVIVSPGFADVLSALTVKVHASSGAANAGTAVANIAKAITNAGGTSSVIDAYAKYIHDDSPVYVQRKTVSPQDAVEIIYDAGGIPVIAHPHDIDIAEELIKKLDPSLYTGRSASQVTEFVEKVVQPLLERYSEEVKSDLKV